MSRFRLALICAALGVVVLAQHLPFTAIDHPQFEPAAKATFLSSSDLLLGVSQGGVAKAYPAAIVAQHGLVSDRMPDGPIAITW